MPDEPNSAAPSAAATVAPDPELPNLESLTASQLHDWRMTGKLPVESKIVPPAEKAAAQESSETLPPAGDGAVETAPAPEPGKAQEPSKKQDGERRKGQLASEIQQLLKQRSELRQENQRLTAERVAPAAAEKKAAPPAALERPKTPREADFETLEAYETALAQHEPALDQYYAALADSRIAAAIAQDRQQREQAAFNRAVEQQIYEDAVGWAKKAAAYQKENPTEVASYKELTDGALEEIHEGSLLDKWLQDSDYGPALLVYFGKNPGEIDRIDSLHPFQAGRELHSLELTLSKSNGTNKGKVPAPFTMTAAPRPAKALAGTATPPGDAVEAAIDAGDTGAYIKAANARDALTRKG